jgi:DNA-binding transcriptional ArsR family regulator
MIIDPQIVTFAAIADPARRAILARLSKGEAAAKQLAMTFNMTLPAISKHLKVMEKADLIERSHDAQLRPCKLRIRPLKEAASWIDSPHLLGRESRLTRR